MCISYGYERALTVSLNQAFDSVLLFTGVDSVEFTQSDNIVVRPGEVFTISCKFSGFSISSYCPYWIRQTPSMTMEYVGHVCSSSSFVKDSLKNKISFSADVSSSTVFLKGQNFQTEDTAVYYCAREPQSFRLLVQLYKNQGHAVMSSVQSAFGHVHDEYLTKT